MAVMRLSQRANYLDSGSEVEVADIRNYGLAGALTISPIAGEPAKRPYLIAMKMWQKGFYVRYGGDTIQLGLPFTSELSEIDSLINALGETLNEIA